MGVPRWRPFRRPRKLAEQSKFTCQVLLPPETRSHGFEGFQPGSGPYKVEVRAVNRAKLWSDASEVEVITAFLPPPAPVQLAARLLPGWASRTLSPLHFEGTTGLLDFDVVKLEFISPIEDAAHPIQSYIIHAEEELSEAGSSQKVTDLCAGGRICSDRR
ncbi:Hypothetical protein SCF082_LOCUS11907 [Durusdinium trenchii]|uniref:Uncharacterized protein n=1 Tax=Durusdinium trenchii TaxID=1381693 RepID=A0ABP0JGB7_9DINO